MGSNGHAMLEGQRDRFSHHARVAGVKTAGHVDGRYTGHD
jgi:hypothetical protein